MPSSSSSWRARTRRFQLHTLDGKIARHFIVRNLRVVSKRGLASAPAFAIGFKDGAYGFATMSAKNKQLAFMQGIQNKDIQIQETRLW